MNKTLKISVSTILSSIVLGAIIWIIQEDLVQIKDRLLNLSIMFLLLGTGMHVITLSLKAARYRMLNEKEQFSTLLHISNISNMLNSILPFRLGEISYLRLAKQHLSSGYLKTTYQVIIMRMADVIAILAIGSFLALGIFSLSTALILTTITIGAVIIYFGFENIYSYFHKKIPVKISFLKSIDNHSSIASLKSKVDVLSLTIAIWFLSGIGLYFLLLSIHMDITIIQTLIVNSLAMLFQIIPSITFANVGIIEAGWYGLLKTLSFSDADAIASGIYVHFISVINATIFGILSYVALKNKKNPKTPKPRI